MQVQFEKIPQFLNDNCQFFNWKFEQLDGNQTKVPYTPGIIRRASVSDPSTFRLFVVAASATGYDGIGIRVQGRVVGIALDQCIVDGKLLPWRRPSSSIGTSSEQPNCPRNRKNRHSQISPNYADIFPRNKTP